MVDSNHPECTGCGACAASCPNHCIDIVIASSGEYRPAINTDNCVNCNLCNKVCVVENDAVKNILLEVLFMGGV